ncbi:MAG: hypothetical protein Q9223_004928 [Gallowayella weberi]
MPQLPATSMPPQNRTPVPDSVAESHLIWTKEREERLVYVQGQLAKAQRRWSEEQVLWIDEVHHLEELKRQCLKAEKKAVARGRANSVAAIWKTKTWDSSKSKAPSAEEENSPNLGDAVENAIEDEDADGEEDADGVEVRPQKSSDSPPTLGFLDLLPTTRTKPFASLFRTISLNSNKDGNQQGSRRSTFDGSRPKRPSLPATPEQSYGGAEMKDKGKARVLQKRRGSGR